MGEVGGVNGEEPASEAATSTIFVRKRVRSFHTEANGRICGMGLEPSYLCGCLFELVSFSATSNFLPGLTILTEISQPKRLLLNKTAWAKPGDLLIALKVTFFA